MPGLVVKLWTLRFVGMGLFPIHAASAYKGMSSSYTLV